MVPPSRPLARASRRSRSKYDQSGPAGASQSPRRLLWRQAGAATFGYGAMGISELRAPQWQAMRLPAVMGLAFNGLAFVASLMDIAGSGLTLLTAVVAPASLFFSAMFVIGMARRGQ